MGPSLAQSTAVDSCVTKEGGVNIELGGGASILQDGLPAKTCQSGLIKYLQQEKFQSSCLLAFGVKEAQTTCNLYKKLLLPLTLLGGHR